MIYPDLSSQLQNVLTTFPVLFTAFEVFTKPEFMLLFSTKFLLQLVNAWFHNKQCVAEITFEQTLKAIISCESLGCVSQMRQADSYRQQYHSTRLLRKGVQKPQSYFALQVARNHDKRWQFL